MVGICRTIHALRGVNIQIHRDTESRAVAAAETENATGHCVVTYSDRNLRGRFTWGKYFLRGLEGDDQADS